MGKTWTIIAFNIAEDQSVESRLVEVKKIIQNFVKREPKSLPWYKVVVNKKYEISAIAVLIPGLDEHTVSVIRSMGYTVIYDYPTSKKHRRQKYTRMEFNWKEVLI